MLPAILTGRVRTSRTPCYRPLMPAITTSDGAQIFYKDWGRGRPIVFSHGWPLNADAWDDQLLFFANNGFRVVAHDRRGHGRSTQTWSGNDMDTYADDLAAVITQLGLLDAVSLDTPRAGEKSRGTSGVMARSASPRWSSWAPSRP